MPSIILIPNSYCIYYDIEIHFVLFYFNERKIRVKQDNLILPNP